MSLNANIYSSETVMAEIYKRAYFKRLINHVFRLSRFREVCTKH